MLLLKSSDRVAHDVCHAFDACGGAPDQARVQYALALRKWIALKPEREFRCFVCTRELVGEAQTPSRCMLSAPLEGNKWLGHLTVLTDRQCLICCTCLLQGGTRPKHTEFLPLTKGTIS